MEKLMIKKTEWPEVAKRLKLQFKHLQDKDLVFVTKKEEELLKKLQARLGRSRREVLELIEGK